MKNHLRALEVLEVLKKYILLCLARTPQAWRLLWFRGGCAMSGDKAARGRYLDDPQYASIQTKMNLKL